MLNVDDSHPAPRLDQVWLALLVASGMFFMGYPLAGHWASQRTSHVLALEWDQYIPFIPWMIWPYLSINFLYPAAFFLHKKVHDLYQFAKQLCVAQFIAMLCFMLFPTRNNRDLSVVDGIQGDIFDQLKSFDAGYNMMPSLHIAVLIIVWAHPMKDQFPKMKGLWNTYALLVAISTLVTWQHYLLDVLAGGLLGWAMIKIFPYRKR